jgi:hypothetical protein
MGFVKQLKVSDSQTINVVSISKEYYDYLQKCEKYISSHKIKLK